MSLTVKLVLTPLLIAQAMRTRARLPRLPEAEGDRQGTVGEGPQLRLLITGDSSAAGVGVVSQRDALAGQLSTRLAEAANVCVEWRLVAKSGLNTAQTLHMLQREPQQQFDIAVVVTGVNDIIDQVPSRKALLAREDLANWLRDAWGLRHVVFAPLPPVHELPGLPQPLRWVSGTDARRHDRALVRWVATRSDVSRVEIDLRLNRGVLAVDGFHPGEPVYRQTAGAIARHIATQVWPTMPVRDNAETSHAPEPVPEPPGQDPVHHRREPRHRPGHRAAGGG